MAQLDIFGYFRPKLCLVSVFPGKGKECDYWWDYYFNAMTAGPLDVQICSNLPVYVLFVTDVPKCAMTSTKKMVIDVPKCAQIYTRKCGEIWIFYLTSLQGRFSNTQVFLAGKLIFP